MKKLSSTIYVMYNPITDVKIDCTESYVKRWEARGFFIKEIIRNTRNKKRFDLDKE